MSFRMTTLALAQSRLLQFCAPLILLLTLSSPGQGGANSKPEGESEAPKSKLQSLAALGLPRYAAPDAYREDLIIENDGKQITMKRFVDHGKTRTEMSADGQSVVMLEMGDEKGTSYSLLPGEKKAMKQTVQGMGEASKPMGDAAKKAHEAKFAPPPDIQAEDLGDDTIDGRAAKKVRMVYGKDPQDVTGWFDKATGAPLRMESVVEGKKAVVQWKDRKTEPQPAEFFRVPKGYEVTDLDEMMKKMSAMGMPVGGSVAGMGLGMAKGMAAGMAQGMAQSFGANLGGSLGASIGGPLGGIAGRFIGGKIGEIIGKKATSAIH